jgi:hypothetical protein
MTITATGMTKRSPRAYFFRTTTLFKSIQFLLAKDHAFETLKLLEKYFLGFLIAALTMGIEFGFGIANEHLGLEQGVREL